MRYRKFDEISPFVPTNYRWKRREFSLELSRELSSKVRENKERNSGISLALLLHNTVISISYLTNRLLFLLGFIFTQDPVLPFPRLHLSGALTCASSPSLPSPLLSSPPSHPSSPPHPPPLPSSPLLSSPLALLSPPLLSSPLLSSPLLSSPLALLWLSSGSPLLSSPLLSSPLLWLSSPLLSSLLYFSSNLILTLSHQ